MELFSFISAIFYVNKKSQTQLINYISFIGNITFLLCKKKKNNIQQDEKIRGIKVFTESFSKVHDILKNKRIFFKYAQFFEKNYWVNAIN